MFNSKKNLEILRKAFDVIALEEAKTLPTPDECEHITFSAEFEQKMRKLINREKKPYYYLINTVGKRVACIILAALITLTSVTFGVKAIREAVIDFFVETFEKFSIVGFKDEDIPENNKTIETYYAPTYIPEGYEIKMDEKFNLYRSSNYESNTGYIYFTQQLNDIDDSYIDTEQSQYENIMINGYKGIIVLKSASCTIYWNDNKYNFLITMENSWTKEEAIRIAESVKAE